MTERKELVTTKEQLPVLTPDEVVENATNQAKLLMDIVEKTQCFQEIGDKKYLQVEAWETIGAFNRVHAETEGIRPIIQDGKVTGYEAHVQLWRDGVVTGGAIMPCYFSENCCKGKEGDAKHKACMSAAQTFATSKAYRMNYSYVAILAGYQPTPAEEMIEDMPSGQREHWCPLHQTKFFKKGKMKAYAHPMKDNNGNDTGEWCYERKKESKAGNTELSPEPITELTPEKLGFIEALWFRESLKKIQAHRGDAWSEDKLLNYLTKSYKVEGKTVEKAVANLSQEAADHFVKKMQEALDSIEKQ